MAHGERPLGADPRPLRSRLEGDGEGGGEGDGESTAQGRGLSRRRTTPRPAPRADRSGSGVPPPPRRVANPRGIPGAVPAPGRVHPCRGRVTDFYVANGTGWRWWLAPQCS